MHILLQAQFDCGLRCIQIGDSLQAVHDCQWLSSIDLSQGYLQLAMDKADCHKTAFHAGSLGLCNFTLMPFGLSNFGLSFCWLMEMSFGYQQFVTLPLYLDDICTFIKSINEMLDQLNTVWIHLR